MAGGLRANYAVMIPPIGTADAAAVRALASTVGISDADARMALASRLPRRVASTATAEEARECALNLRGAGFDAFAASFESLRRRPPQARSATFVPGGVEFEPGGAFAVRLIVHGRILSGQQTKTSLEVRSKHGALVPAGSATVASSDSEAIALFYGERAAQAVDLRPRGFNFRCLGAEAGPTKAAAMKMFLERVRALFPEAAYDDTLLRVAPPSDDTLGAESVDESAMGSARVVRRVQSNEAGVLRAALLIAMSLLRK